MRSIGLIWLGVAVAISVGLGSLDVPRLVQLYRHQGIASGTVERPNCENHGTILYAFVVNDMRYTGRGLDGGDCRRFHPGESITVYYVQGKPEISSLREPGAALIEELVAVVLAGALLPALPIFAWRRKLRRASASPQ